MNKSRKWLVAVMLTVAALCSIFMAVAACGGSEATQSKESTPEHVASTEGGGSGTEVPSEHDGAGGEDSGIEAPSEHDGAGGEDSGIEAPSEHDGAGGEDSGEQSGAGDEDSGEHDGAGDEDSGEHYGVGGEGSGDKGLDTTVAHNRSDSQEPDPVEAGTVVVGGTAAKWGDDDYALNAATITGDTLTVEVSYGGGCEDHTFTLVLGEAFMESFPVQLQAVLAHEANNDPCQAWLTNSYAFDLDLAKSRYEEAYGPGEGSIVLQLDGAPGGELIYEFTN